MRTMQLLLAIALIVFRSTPVHGESVLVAVAANFTAPMQEIAARFEQKTGHTTSLSFGSSGKFFAQIQNGAPFQVFLSADQEKPQALEQAGLTVAGSRFTYALGALALWSIKPDFIDVGLTRLKSGEFTKLALANPKLAPYGAAAVEVLTALGLVQSTESKWVMGENIAQAYQFVASGNADLGFVAVAQIIASGQVQQGSSWLVPPELFAPVRQDAVLLARARDSVGARALLEYLRGDEARAIIRGFGYDVE